jgi:uncharacterized DUF497 family protein
MDATGLTFAGFLHIDYPPLHCYNINTFVLTWMPTMPQFDWDDAKNHTNIAKHGISFEQAKTLWDREHALLIEFDYRHSATEQRLIATGLLPNLTVLVVSYTQRGQTIRIISARRATPSERENYYGEVGYPSDR